MSLSFTSCRVSEPAPCTCLLPQPATRHILPGGTKLNWGGRGSVPTARVRLAFSFNCEGHEGLSVLEKGDGVAGENQGRTAQTVSH